MSYGRVYTVRLAATATTTVTDLIEITMADDRPVVIVGFRVWQTSDLGDAQEEVLELQWIAGNTSSGSGGNTSVAADPTDKRDASAGATIETGNTTAASSGTTRIGWNGGWNIRAPLDVVLTPDQWIRADQGETLLCLRLAAAADSITVGCSVQFMEV